MGGSGKEDSSSGFDVIVFFFLLMSLSGPYKELQSMQIVQ